MPKETIGTASQRIAQGLQRPVIRNLGPGDVGIGTVATVTINNADLYLKPDEAYEFPADVAGSGWGEMYAIASAAGTDVRIAEVG